MPRVTYPYLGKETIEEKSTVYQLCIKLHARSTAQTLKDVCILEIRNLLTTDIAFRLYPYFLSALISDQLRTHQTEFVL
jgi:hypothetical protein